MFVKVRRAFTVGAVLFLLGMFTLPSLYLRTQCAALNGLCGEVLLASRAGDEAAAQAQYEALQARFEAMRRLGSCFWTTGSWTTPQGPLPSWGSICRRGTPSP